MSNLKQLIKVKSNSLIAKINFERFTKIVSDTFLKYGKSLKSKFPKINIKYLKNSLSFYWYTGEKKIALGAGAIGILLSILFLVVTVGANGIALIFAIIADKLIIWGSLLYIFFIRNMIPLEMISDRIDAFFMQYFIYALIAILLNRMIVNLVAEKVFAYNLIDNKSRQIK